MLAEKEGPLPVGWSATRLGRYTAESKDRAGEGHNLPVLSVTKHRGILRSEEFFKKAVHSRDTSKYKVVRPGQFAYATIHLNEGSVGKLETCTPGVVSPMYTVFDVNEQIDSDYLLEVLKSRQSLSLYESITQGTVNRRGGISFTTLSDLVLHHPPLSEQHKTASILSSVDDAIEKTQAVIDQVQVVKRGLMQELLTRGLPGQHRRFKPTQVGEVPEDWKISRISEIARCHYGTSKALKSEKGGIPVLRMGNLRDGRVHLDDVKYLEEGKVSDDLLLSFGDVLFNRTNSADLVGKVSVFDHSIRASFASYLLRLRIEPSIGSGSWLAYLLNTGTVQRLLRATATPGVSQVNINRKNLLATPVPVPPIQEQAAIVAMLDSIQHRVEVEQSKVERLAELKSALVSVLLTGELRVTPDPDPE